ncbi:MAG: Hsp20/alpha crystallin family protein [Actinomycetota bacterium]|nr:Hsp20/alpha crystallin family protein [Actinomycetota bacterium]
MALPIRRRESRSSAPSQWSPTAELEEMHERIGRLLSGAFEDLGGAGAGLWSPLVDIEETDDAWVVEADLPGVKRGDVTVDLQDSELAISGEVKEKERTGILRRRTRRTGRFDYRVTLPGEFDPDAVEAELDSGVLTVRLPKPERAQRRRVEVRGG